MKGRVEVIEHCPTCGVYVSTGYILYDAPQKIENKVCKNGHPYLSERGGMGGRTYAIEEYIGDRKVEYEKVY
jgi:hypothetical protein